MIYDSLFGGIFGGKKEDPYDQTDPQTLFNAFARSNPIAAFKQYNARPGEIVMDNGAIYFECSKDSVTPNEDRLNPAQKVELVGMLDSNGNVIIEKTGTVYYGIKIKLAENWVTTKTHCTFLQFHKVDSAVKVGTKPALALSTELNAIYLKVRGGNINYPSQLSDKEILLTKNTLALGKWITLIIKSTWDKAAGGVEVFRKDEGETSFSPVASIQNVPTIFYDKAGIIPLVYHTGIYRKPEDFINGMWIGGTVRGASFDEVKNII